MNSTPIYKFSAPKDELLERPPPSHPILTDGYELHPAFIAMVREQLFSRREDENPYTHLWEFEQREIIKWKLFPFSLLGRAKQCYAHTVGGINGNWDELRDKFYLSFFPLSQIIALRIPLLTFQ